MPNIKCFEKNYPELKPAYEKLVKEGVSEIEAATRVINDEGSSLTKQVNDLKSSINSKIKKSVFVPFENKNEIEKVKKEFDDKIADQNQKLDAIRNDEQRKQIKELIKKAENISSERLAEIISQKASIPLQEAKQLVNEVRGEKPRVRVVVGKDETKKAKGVENNPKAILNAIYDAENISQSIKNKFEKEGLTYNPQSHEEARKIAKEIVSYFGVDNAINMAEAGRFDGDVNSLIFAEGIDATFLEEKNATSADDKIKAAERWADYAVRYDNIARQQGRFISAIYDFYRKSPLGVILTERKKREEAFRAWYKNKEGSFKELFEAIKESEDVKLLIQEKVELKLKEERASFRKNRRDKISSFFNKAKIGKKGINSSIIPPQIWDAAIDVMEQAALAGESLVAIIEAGVDYIKKNHNDAWDEQAFRKEWEERLQAMDGEKAIPKDKQEKILERFRKKLAGLTDEQKADVIRKSFKKLVENNALKYDDFKKIVADTLGIGELSAEDTQKLTQFVTDINAVQDAADNVVKQTDEAEIKKAIQEFDKVARQAEKSATQLAGMLYNKPDIGGRVRSIIQLNTLGAVSLLKNPFYNIFHQLLVRFPKGLLLTVIDQSIYAASLLGNKLFGNPVIKPDTNIFLAQKGYFDKAGVGASESVKQVFTGLTNKDYFQKEVYNAQIKPAQSWRDIWAYAKGEKFLTRGQFWDKIIQGTVGVPAEMVARVLNIGDKPFRYAAESAIAETMAQQEFKLSGVQKERFLKFPKEVAKSEYLKKGYSEDEASKKAEEVEQRIIKEGEEAVFQQENWFNEKIKKLKQSLSSGDVNNPLATWASETAKLLGTLNAPFLKTPINLFWEIFNLVNPEVAILQSFVYGVKAYRNKSKADFIQSKKWLAHAAVGYSLMSAIGYLAGMGIISGDDEDEQFKEKEEKGKSTYAKKKTINISKLNRVFGNGNLGDEDGDVMVDLSWFGTVGMIMNLQANKQENLSKEERESMTYLDDLLGRMRASAVDGLENSVFQGTFSAIDAFRTGRVDGWLTNMLNVGANFIEPATIAQISRATRPTEYRIKGDDLPDRLANSLKARFFGSVPPRINIWGEEMKREGTVKDVALRMLGVSVFDKDAFAIPIYEDFKRTGDASFFPPVVASKFSYKGEQIELNANEHEQLQKLVGQARASIIAPFVNGMATIQVEGENKKYNDLNDTEKIEWLEKIYKKGYTYGKKQFIQLNPKYVEDGKY